MIHTKQAIVVAIAVLGASVAAFGQSEPRNRGNRDQAAIEAFGLTEEQVDQIREIRRERPPRDQDQEERQAWRDGQTSKIHDVLTEEQKTKIAEAQAAAAQMRTFVAAARMGLTEFGRPGPDFRGARNRGPRGGRAFRSGQRGRGAPAFRRGGRGPGFRARAKGPRGPQAWSPRGRRGGPDSTDRRGWGRD